MDDEEPAPERFSLILDASTRRQAEAEDARGPAFTLLRQAVQATILTIRSKKDVHERKEVDPTDLGSLLDFLGPQKFGCEVEPSPTISTCTPATVSKAQLSEVDSSPLLPSLPPEPALPPYFGGGPRRRVSRAGNRLTVNRSGCPRSVQLRAMLPSLRAPAVEATPATPSSARSPPRLPATPRRGGRPSGVEPLPGASAKEQHQGHRSRSQPPQPHSNFNPTFLTGTSAKPQERHPLLIAMEEQEDLDVTTRRTGFETAALLSHRLGDRIWDDPRKGFWTTPAEWAKAPGGGTEDDILPPKARAKKAGEKLTKRPPQSSSDKRTMEEMQQLLRVMDPEGFAALQPQLIVALLFWQGLARRRSTAMATLERAFGPGDIPCSSLLELSKYAEVQVRIVEGLRGLAQRESLEHLCEFMAEGDIMRPRRWFGTMKRDPTGHADIGQILRWLAQMEIISGRQDLFRFLSNVDLNEASTGRDPLDAGGSDYRKRNFRLEDFVCLLCRCTITWCLFKTIELLNPPEGGSMDGAAALEGDPAAPSAPSAVPAARELCTDNEMGKRWAELERHIGVSFFVNQKFWGPECRQVVMSVRPLRAATIGQELTQEQWTTLYQRVRAQGMAAILPEGEDAEDPNFLFNLASQNGVWAAGDTGGRTPGRPSQWPGSSGPRPVLTPNRGGGAL